jgi:hypothetical protein
VGDYSSAAFTHMEVGMTVEISIKLLGLVGGNAAH